MSGFRASARWRAIARAAVAALLVAAGLVGALPTAARVNPTAAVSPRDSPSPLRPYFVRLARPNALLEADAPPADLEARAVQSTRNQIAGLLGGLKDRGAADAAIFDAQRGGFRVNLAANAVPVVEASSVVAAVEPDAALSSAGVPPAPTTGAATPSRAASTNPSISSVNFIQVYSPFTWGHVNVGGLMVALYLEDSGGNVIGVPVQTCSAQGCQPQATQTQSCQAASPPTCVKIDRTQLYYETTFVDPNVSGHPPVDIAPGDKVRAVTSDPAGGQPTDDRTIVVDDVQAWTSYQNDAVSGWTSAASNPVVVTVGTGLSTASYLTPGTSMTYATTTSDGNGNFAVSKFITTSGSTPAAVNLAQGSTGFVRVQHSDGNEVYAVHGQNVLPLENSFTTHGYAFQLPGPPFGLDPNVAVPRPLPTVSISLKDYQGQVKDAAPGVVGLTPYVVTFHQMIVGGDVVTVTINNAPPNVVATSPLAGAIDLAGQQITGSGPPNTSVTVGAGRIDGYISASSTFTYVPKQVTTSSAGAFATGKIACGTANSLLLQAGSFGYAGYEDARGNFIYEDFAAPRADVLTNYPFVEGWVADGTVRPTVTVLDPTGNVKSEAMATPVVGYLVNQRLYDNVYYNLTPTQFILPGDTVVITGGSRTDTISVDNLAAYVDTDANRIAGAAPAGSTVKVIPFNAKTAFQNAVADASGAFTAGNPFSSFNDGSCTTSASTQNFAPGAVGRAYVAHSDGNTVFTVWGRALHVNENENFVEAYLYPTRDLDWGTTPAWPSAASTVTVTKPDGGATSVGCPAPGPNPSCTVSGPLPADTAAYVLDSLGQKVLIFPGDAVAATFTEGPPAGPNRAVTLSLTGIPLVTGSPDLTTSTVAGVGPGTWDGLASLNAPVASSVIPIRGSTAYAPITFVSGLTKVKLALGYSGTVSFTDTAGHRVWAAWAATAYPVHLNGILNPGETVVCGTATKLYGITIYDATTQPLPQPIGTGNADANGNFCVTVSPPLYVNEVLLARDSNGTYSQPYVVRPPLYLPAVTKG